MYEISLLKKIKLMSEYLKKIEIDNKGTGFVAHKNIMANETILEENVMVSINEENNITCHEVYFKIILLVSKNKKLWSKFLNFSPHELDDYCMSQEKINCLVNSLQPKIRTHIISTINKTEWSIYYEKVKRNIFWCSNHFFIIFEGTLFNHSCNPNVDYYCDSKLKKIRFESNREIKQSEELTISYVHPLSDKSKLLTTYGFVCSCSECTVECAKIKIN